MTTESNGNGGENGNVAPASGNPGTIEGKPLGRPVRQAPGRLVIQREDIRLSQNEEELETPGWMDQVIRRPGKREWFILDHEQVVFTTRLAIQEEGMTKTHYYVDPRLRDAVEEHITDVAVLPYWSLGTNRWHLWIINIANRDNEWTRSLLSLLRLEPSDREDRKYRVTSNVNKGRYTIKYKSCDQGYDPLPAPTGQMLAEALGPNVIDTVDHELYAELIEGEFLK